MLLNPSLVSLPHNRPITGRWDVEARNSNFIQKARHPRIGWVSALKYQLIRIWIPVSFIEQRRGGEEVRLARYLMAWPGSGMGGCFLLFCSHSQVGRVRMFPRELKKALYFNIQAEGKGSPRQAIMYPYSYRQHPFSDHSNKSSGE